MPVLMPNPVFRWFVPASVGGGLVPAAGYKAKFYAAGTATAKTIYEIDDTPYPSPSNTAVLNAEGYAEIKLGNGNYKLVVTDPDDSPVYTQDNIGGGNSFGSGFVGTVIATDDPPTNGLAQVDTANAFTWCAGYYAAGDGGHGFFRNIVSSDPDDTGYVIASTFDPTRRWFRIPDEDGWVRAASFGYIGTTATNQTEQLLAAAVYCTTNDKGLSIGPGDAGIVGSDTDDLYIYSPFVRFEAGSIINGTGLYDNLVFTGQASGTAETHFASVQAQFELPQLMQNPEWFGASTFLDATSNTAAFTKWFASLPNGGAFLLPPGTWNYSDTTSFPYPTIPFYIQGTINATVGTDIGPGEYLPAGSRITASEFAVKDAGRIYEVAGKISTTTDVYIQGSLQVADVDSTGDINATGTIGAYQNVVAGSTSGGAGGLFQRAGTADYLVRAASTYAVVLGSAVTSGTGLTTLLGTTLYANTLLNNGDYVRIKIAGNMSGGSGVKGVSIFVGITLVAAISGTVSAPTWELTVDVYKSGSNFYSFYQGGASNAGAPTADIYEIDNLTGALNFAADWPIFAAAQAATGTITQKLLSVEFYPAN